MDVGILAAIIAFILAAVVAGIVVRRKVKDISRSH